MDKVSAKTYLSNLTIPGASTRFMLKPVGTVTVTFDELCEKVAERSGLAVSTVKYALESANQKLIDLLVKNCRIHTGLYVASLGIGGSVGSMGEQPNKVTNPVHAVLTPEGDIVDTVKAIEVENVTVTVAAILNEVQQNGLDELNKITLAETAIVANGRNIAIDTTKSDEGVWLANRVTGAMVKKGTITETDSSRCVFTFDALPDNGQYDLVIATRNNEADMDVVTVSRVVTVEAAA